MTVEAAHHSTAEVLRDINPVFLPPQENPQALPEQVNQEYKYPLQQRIATEWVNLFGENFTTSTNVAVFKDKLDQLKELVKNPNAPREDVLRTLSYLKIGAISIATSKKKDISSAIEEKLELMQRKYPPDAVTELRLLGYSTSEACGILKNLYENGQRYVTQGVKIPHDEKEARMPRKPAFKNPHQDFGDTWARASYGRDIVNHDATGIVINEAQELLDEFDYEEHTIVDFRSNFEKLELIAGEIADVVISGDGKFSHEDECVERWENFALDRMIDTYGDLPKLRRMGVSTQIGMHYLREYRHRAEKGLSRPISPVPGYKGPVFRITSKVPPEQDSSLEMLH